MDTGDERPPNVLVIVADDLGIEASACYEGLIEADRPPQPTLSGLCDEGLTFTDAWAYPNCSPTRSALMTGKYAWRTGIGRALNAQTSGLSRDEVTIAHLLEEVPTAYVGKWHLSGSELDVTHPGDMGWQHFTGTMKGSVDNYYAFEKVTDGQVEMVYDYATTTVVDDALAWLQDRDESPWVLFVSFQAAHTPLHVPPAELIEDDTLEHYGTPLAVLFHAIIEAMDVEMGRLLSEIDRDNTVIIYVSDNGSAANTNQGIYPEDQAKSSLYQGGVHVPMVIAGPGIASGEVDAMVHVVDLFATVLELTGAPAAALHDSVSLVPYLTDPDTPPLRELMLTEYFGDGLTDDVAGRAARTEDYKLIQLFTGHTELYNLSTDPLETNNLIQGALDSSAMDAWHMLSDYLDEISESADD